MKFPFLSRLLEIKEEQLIIEENKLEILLDNKDLLRGIRNQLSEIEARLILNGEKA